jgi:hypothetical protein
MQCRAKRSRIGVRVAVQDSRERADGPGGRATHRDRRCIVATRGGIDRDYPGEMHRIFSLSFAVLYPLYVTKVEKKGRTTQELDEVIEWLTGFDDADLQRHIAEHTTLEDFFADADLNPNAPLITGVICGMRVEEIEDPLMQKIRYMDKLVDELARGKAMAKILRTA